MYVNKLRNNTNQSSGVWAPSILKVDDENKLYMYYFMHSGDKGSGRPSATWATLDLSNPETINLNPLDWRWTNPGDWSNPDKVDFFPSYFNRDPCVIIDNNKKYQGYAIGYLPNDEESKVLHLESDSPSGFKYETNNDVELAFDYYNSDSGRPGTDNESADVLYDSETKNYYLSVTKNGVFGPGGDHNQFLALNETTSSLNRIVLGEFENGDRSIFNISPVPLLNRINSPIDYSCLEDIDYQISYLPSNDRNPSYSFAVLDKDIHKKTEYNVIKKLDTIKGDVQYYEGFDVYPPTINLQKPEKMKMTTFQLGSGLVSKELLIMDVGNKKILSVHDGKYKKKFLQKTEFTQNNISEKRTIQSAPEFYLEPVFSRKEMRGTENDYSLVSGLNNPEGLCIEDNYTSQGAPLKRAYFIDEEDNKKFIWRTPNIQGANYGNPGNKKYKVIGAGPSFIGNFNPVSVECIVYGSIQYLYILNKDFDEAYSIYRIQIPSLSDNTLYNLKNDNVSTTDKYYFVSGLSMESIEFECHTFKTTVKPILDFAIVYCGEQSMIAVHAVESSTLMVSFDKVKPGYDEILFDKDKNINGGGINIGTIKSPVFLTYLQLSNDSPKGGTKVFWSKEPGYFDSGNYLGWFPYTALKINTDFSREAETPDFVSYTNTLGWGINDFYWIHTKH